jgi:hypothetical protein
MEQHFAAAHSGVGGVSAQQRAGSNAGLVLDRHTSSGSNNSSGGGGGVVSARSWDSVRQGPHGAGLPHGLDFLRTLTCLVVLARTDKVMNHADQKQEFARLIGLVLERSRGVKILLVSEQPLAGVLPGIGEKVVSIDSMPLVENQRLFKKKVMNNHTYGSNAPGSNSSGAKPPAALPNAQHSGDASTASVGGGWGAGMGAAVQPLVPNHDDHDWLTKSIVNCPEYKSLEGMSPRLVCEAANSFLLRLRKQVDWGTSL